MVLLTLLTEVYIPVPDSSISKPCSYLEDYEFSVDHHVSGTFNAVGSGKCIG